MKHLRRLALAASAVALACLIILSGRHEEHVGTSEAIKSVVKAHQPQPSPFPASGSRSVAEREWIGSKWETEDEPAMAAFSAWASRFQKALPADQTALVAQGLQAASRRREVLARWIRDDPRRALAAAVPVMVRRSLPPGVTALLEERISGSGELALIGATPLPGRTLSAALFRKALIDRREFWAYTYGRRNGISYLPNASIIGIAIDDALAVSDSPVRLLESGEPALGREVRASCPVSQKPSATPSADAFNTEKTAPVAVEANGMIEVVCEPAHLLDFEARLIQAEGGGEQILGNNLPGTSGITGRPAITWTHGTKKILVIRVDFSDVPGTPVNPYDSNAQITANYAVNVVNAAGGVKDFYEQASFGKTSLNISTADVTSVLRMPSTASSYASTYLVSELHSDARKKAEQAGFNLADYDRIGVVFSDLSDLPNSKFLFGGLGSIEAKNFWVNGWWSFELVAHEVGHNYGLHHANLWKVPGTDPLAATGLSEEYGDQFDIMGKGSSLSHHFSHWNKSVLQWIPDTAVTTISQTGSYRVYRFDHQSASLSNALALKIVRNRTEDYWIGYRRATTNASLNSGAYVLWGSNTNTMDWCCRAATNAYMPCNWRE